MSNWQNNTRWDLTTARQGGAWKLNPRHKNSRFPQLYFIIDNSTSNSRTHPLKVDRLAALNISNMADRTEIIGIPSEDNNKREQNINHAPLRLPLLAQEVYRHFLNLPAPLTRIKIVIGCLD